MSGFVVCAFSICLEADVPCYTTCELISVVSMRVTVRPSVAEPHMSPNDPSFHGLFTKLVFMFSCNVQN